MNALELKENKQLSSFDVVNLNIDGKLPYEDSSFDVVTCVVSVDYLNKPREVNLIEKEFQLKTLMQ